MRKKTPPQEAFFYYFICYFLNPTGAIVLPRFSENSFSLEAERKSSATRMMPSSPNEYLSMMGVLPKETSLA